MNIFFLQKLRVIKNAILGKPILTIFDVTKLCNQRCPMCNIWKTESDDMSLDVITKKANELQKFGIGYVFLQGGEPTIRKDILQIIDIFIERGIKTTIITNGLLLTNDFTNEIAKRKCNLSISIDSLNSELFSKLRGVNKLELILNNVKNISEIKKHKGNWSITSTITKLSTLEDIKSLHEIASKYGFMYAIRPYVFVNGTAGKKDAELLYNYNDVENIFNYMINNAKKENYLAYLVYKKHIDYIKGKPMRMCDAMRRSFLLKENGCISPCIEFTNIELNLCGGLKYLNQYNNYKGQFKQCNNDTPCFYNDAREIGILLNSIPILILNFPKILKQMIKYGNFF